MELDEEPTQISATEARKHFGDLVDRAAAGEILLITRRDAPACIMISPELFRALLESHTLPSEVRAEFDALYASMQTPEASTALRRAFAATPAEMHQILKDASVRGYKRTTCLWNARRLNG